jgi:hypothetical protein
MMMMMRRSRRRRRRRRRIIIMINDDGVVVEKRVQEGTIKEGGWKGLESGWRRKWRNGLGVGLGEHFQDMAMVSYCLLWFRTLCSTDCRNSARD